MTPGNDSGPDAGLSADPGERYERGERIATGGMGEVWRARDTVLGREVAVKILKREYADDPTFRARFEAEARHAAGLHHPGIASVFDYGLLRAGNTPYLVMELVDGKPLSDLLASGEPFDPEQARLLALQTAEALAVAHAAGVVHRDVKPGNLLVTPDGRIKITDFGIARATGSVAFTQTGQIVGTPHYLSPEQARGDSATAASDVYALGVVLFECLTGKRPFSADTPIATALAQIQQDVPPLPDSVPPALAAVVARALTKNPAERYADGAELANALRAAGGDEPLPVPAPVPEPTQVMTATAAATAVAPVVEPPTAPPPESVTTTSSEGRSRWPLYVAGALALLVLAGLLIAHPWTKDDATTDSSTSTGSQGDTVRVRRSDYLGDPVKDVRDALKAKGLKTRVETQDNSGDHDAGTVADLSPTGLVKKGATITLQVWGVAPAQPPANDNPDQTKPADPETTKTKIPKPKPSTPVDPGATTAPGKGDKPTKPDKGASPAGRVEPAGATEPSKAPKPSKPGASAKKGG